MKKHGIGWLNIPGYVPQTWNPIVGCSNISEGCRNCYAERMAKRLAAMGAAGYTDKTDTTGLWNGKTELLDAVLEKPPSWKKPRAIFVNSMGDLFHENTPDEWIDRVFAVMALCPQHLFIVLTKRAERMERYLATKSTKGDAAICRAINEIPAALGDRHGCLEMPLPNVWLGVTAENQSAADERIPHLLRTPAAVRFISCEPMLEALNLGEALDPCAPDCRREMVGTYPNRGHWHVPLDKQMLHWIICGGESGPGARPMNPKWARSLRDQANLADVPFFFKQWGSALSGELGKGSGISGRRGGDVLDGERWHEWPEVGAE
jgi:protein gp37